MARNAADAARSDRPQGENFSESLQVRDREVSVTNCTGWKAALMSSILGFFFNNADSEKFS
jgi:hypothetical protein